MSDPELLDCEGDFHGAGRLRASVAYDDRNVGRFRLVRVAVPHDFDGGPDGFKSSGCGVCQGKPVLVLDGYAVGANVEVEVRHGRQCHASQTVALTYERGRPPAPLLLAGSLKAPIMGALTGRGFILSVAISGPRPSSKPGSQYPVGGVCLRPARRRNP